MDFLEKWEVFYWTYSKWRGFNIRIDDGKKRDGVISMHRWVFSKEGFRSSQHAKLKEACKRKMQFLRSHRNVPDTVVAQEITMNKVGIKTSSVVAHLALKSGGYKNFPFQLRDMYNKVAKIRNEQKLESDSEGALDINSRRDYMLFGEAIAFDSTYKTNKYNKSLVIIVNVNQHFDTCVFGLALLFNETEDTFCWLLMVFLDCMGNKKLKVVLADGDDKMAFAIHYFLSSSTCRLYVWHLGNNETKKIKLPPFTTGFVKLIYQYYTDEEFEEKWVALLKEFDPQNSSWCHEKYNTRDHWLETFLRGVFYGGMRTTQRCESINFALKRFLLANYTLRDFVSQIDLAVTTMCHKEGSDD
ncbi:protein FAR-RED IMPAIRED RESPONSE 1-like [Humulus lupulus]|uniref:protein FAR-RED IMPAIRED RESPONSE 1-like n=1 Tax=Humulus lupulus TaxID=3486 RepID=UPI002B405705|nr:protein FAR-RED IMPAIRED RESPONSE 1-like [Humulus lupulus]